jgi:hypothetical protein
MDRETYLNTLHINETSECITKLLYLKTYINTTIQSFPFDIIQYIGCFLKQEILKSYIYNIIYDVSMTNSDYEIEGFPFRHSTLNCTIECELVFSQKDDISYLFEELIKITIRLMDNEKKLYNDDMIIYYEIQSIRKGWDGLVYLQGLLIHLSVLLDKNYMNNYLKNTLTLKKGDWETLDSYIAWSNIDYI